MNLRRWLVLCVAVLGLETEAKAHFLFIRIGPMAEAGRWAEVYFSEQAEAGDPKFVAKVAGTRLWLQSSPGRFEPLTVRQAADRLRAPVPAPGSVAVVGECEYGVLARPNQVPFLLRYYPKAVAGRPDTLNRLTPRPDSPLEITATFEGKRVRLVVLKDGKPVPGAVLNTVDADLAGGALTAGPDGVAAWTPPSPGSYSIYTRDTMKTSGESGGKSYEEIRAFATLAFTWPLEGGGADPEAVALFEDAIAARSQWKDFPGFTAKLAGEADGRAFTGSATFRDDGTVEIKADDPVAQPWLEDQLGSLAMHRVAEATADASTPRPKPVVRFGDDRDDHPLGRLLIFEGGRFASSYRVKDRQLLVVNRRAGKRNMTITVLQNDRNAEGHFLPRRYLVHYWDAATGTLDRVETIQDEWLRVGSWDLPRVHTMTTASDAGLSVRSAVLSDHALIKAKE